MKPCIIYDYINFYSCRRVCVPEQIDPSSILPCPPRGMATAGARRTALWNGLEGIRPPRGKTTCCKKNGQDKDRLRAHTHTHEISALNIHSLCVPRESSRSALLLFVSPLSRQEHQRSERVCVCMGIQHQRGINYASPSECPRDACVCVQQTQRSLPCVF